MTVEKLIAAYNAAGPKGQKFITGKALEEMRRMDCPIKSRTSLHHWRKRGGQLPRSPINNKYKKAFAAAVAAYEAQKKEDGQTRDRQAA